jgi:DNA-binding transcriptional LysR family regulator
MTLQQLRYALMIAETGTFSEASKRLYLSQPSLSFSIKGLEDELGITIFERSNKGSLVTEEGKDFLKNAKQLVSQFEQLGEKYSIKSAERLHFSVSSQHYTFVSEAFAELIDRYDGIEYKMVLNEAKTLEILEDVKSLRSELGVLHINSFNESVINKILRESNLLFDELFTTYPYILVGENNPLAQRPRVGIADLTDYPCVSFAQEDLAPDWFSEEVINILAQKKSIKISDRDTLANLLLTTNAYIVSTGVSDMRETAVIPLDLEGTDNIIRIGLVFHREIKHTAMAKTFIDLLKDIILSYVPHEHVRRFF